MNTFLDAVGMVKAVLRVEGRYPDPPRPRQLATVQGLRGGAAVLVVGAFENYLRESMEEYLGMVANPRTRIVFAKLPDSIRIHTARRSMEMAIRGYRHQQPMNDATRLVNLQQAAQKLVSGQVEARAFADSRGNPNSQTTRDMFKPLGYSDIFSMIKTDFDIRWGSATAQRFIPDKLDEIVNRRHVVAHTANVLNVSRRDLGESVRFTQSLAQSLDAELRSMIRVLKRTCR